MVVVIVLLSYLDVCAKFPEPYSVIKDITGQDRVFTLKENTVTIFHSKPASPMKPFNIFFKFQVDNIKNLSYSTNMNMNMGRYVFIPSLANGLYSVTLVLPKCGSGNSLWYGKLDITYTSGTAESIVFFYNVK